MPYNANDRMRVARVRVTSQGGERELTDCWISINAEKKQVGIWLDTQGAGPALTAPLADTQIEWHRSAIGESPKNPDVPLPIPGT